MEFRKCIDSIKLDALLFFKLGEDMSRIAFDCSGTLIGNRTNTNDVVALFKWFQSQGHEVVIWSNSYSYTQDAKREHMLDCECETKHCRWDHESDEEYYDIAIDDDMSQTYLATHNLLSVYDIPSDESLFEEKYGHLLK